MEHDLQRGHRGMARSAAVCMALVLLAFSSSAHCVPASGAEAQALPEPGLPASGRLVTVYVTLKEGGPRHDQVRLPASLLDEMASLRDDDPNNPWSIWDNTIAFPWLRHGRILHCDWPDVVIYLEPSGKAVILNRKPGYAQIRKILEEDIPDALHDKQKFQVMLDTLRYWTVPGGVLGTEKEFRRLKEHGDLEGWFRGARVKDVSVFHRYCRDPVFSYDSKSGKWSLSFYVFNREGGVSLVKAQGSDKPFRIEALTVEEAMKPRSFHYPLVG